MQQVGVWKPLSVDTISGTLKFGFSQTHWKYPIADASTSIIDRLYHDAEKLVRDNAHNYRNGQITGRFTIYLFRVPAAEFTMVPILQASDVEQNSLIEIVLVPAETSQNAHVFHACQLAKPTNCSRCTKLITGIYKQGFRCEKCRMTYHKSCARFLIDDCPVQANSGTIRRPSSSTSGQLIFINPFVTDSTSSMDRTATSSTTTVPIYRASTSTAQENAEVIEPNKIIEKGIFPACIRGSHFYRRFLFRLTINSLSMTATLSPNNIAQTHVFPSSDVETIFPLTDIMNLILTHLEEDKDDVFEIHLSNKSVLSVGKKTDSHELQMETAQFYSSIREQWGSCINSKSPSNTSSMPTPAGVSKAKTNSLPPLAWKSSNYSLPPLGEDNEQKDLHEVYSLTGEKIGEGAFGRVVGAYKKTTRYEVAIKIMEKENCTEQDMKRINEEVNNLYKFNHVNILKLEAYYERDDAVYLVTERMETDMCKYINKKEEGYLNEDLCRIIIYQLIVAVRYLHRNNCGHLDIKCENILISLLKPMPKNGADPPNKEYPLVKLADFGYSRIIGENSFRKTRVGTKVYNAPEIYRGTSGYNRLADMWSVGIVLYAGLSGTLPYDEKGSQRAEEIVRDRRSLFAGSRWKKVSKEAKDLIVEKLLVIQTASRVTSNDALFDPWFDDPDLFSSLREIERRTKYLMSTRNETLPTSSTWLIGEREDPVWTAWREAYAQSSVPQ